MRGGRARFVVFRRTTLRRAARRRVIRHNVSRDYDREPDVGLRSE
jgi:hypothetical protein